MQILTYISSIDSAYVWEIPISFTRNLSFLKTLVGPQEFLKRKNLASDYKAGEELPTQTP